MGKIFIPADFFVFKQDTAKKSVVNTDSIPILKESVNQPVIKTKQNDSIPIKETIKPQPVVKRHDTLSITSHKTSIAIISSKPLPEQSEQDTQTTRAVPQKTIEKWNTPEKLIGELFSSNAETHHLPADSSGYTNEIKEINPVFKEPFLKRTGISPDWIFWTFIIIIFLFLWIRVFYRKYMGLLFGSTVSYQISSKLFNERNVLTRRVSFVLNFVYTLSLSMFIYKGLINYGFDVEETDRLSFFLVILNVIILFSIGKVILHRITGFIFDNAKIVNEYLHNIYLINKSTGIVLLPITFITFYSSLHQPGLIIVAGIVILIISLFIKIIRSFQIIIKNEIFIFYPILYLCTLEILPILVGIKFLKTVI